MHVLLYLLVFCWADLFFAQLWTEQSILTASDKTSYDYFGSSVSLTDNYALVGASRCCLACNCDPSGFAYVFVRSGTTWSQQAKLTASIKAVDDYFGRSVSVTDNYAFVGAHNADSGALANAGAAYIFVRSGTSWTEQLVLTASNKAADDQFGWSVSLTDNYALIGAHNTAPRSGEYGTGTAYVFIRSGASWTEQAILMASNRATGNRFGSSVSLTDNYALIGAPLANVGSVVSAGAAYVFGRSGTTWTEQAILTASSRGTGDNLGKFVSLTDNYALVGLYSSVSKSYIFSRLGSAWTLQTVLPSVSSPSSGRRALAISNQYAIVENQIFTRSGNTWSSQASLSRSSLYSVAITTNYAIIGNGDVDFGGIYNAGQAYVFYASCK